MVIIKGGRQSGKTTALVRYSAETGIPIMCMGFIKARHLKELAKRLGLTIPEPKIWDGRQEGRARTDKRVLIDDAEQFLQMVLAMTAGAQAEVMTMNVPILDLDRLDSNFESSKTIHIGKISREVHLYGQWEGEEKDAE